MERYTIKFMSRALVRVNKYSKLIKELPPHKRIAVDYPLLVRDEVARKVAKVAEQLPKKYQLQIDSAYRDRDVQKMIYAKKPQITYNPDNGIPPHSTGGAVDVLLLNADGEGEKLLTGLMIKEGFAPHSWESWHYSYGDLAWAGYYKRQVLYEELKLDNKIYYPLIFRILVRVYLRLAKLLSI